MATYTISYHIKCITENQTFTKNAIYSLTDDLKYDKTTNNICPNNPEHTCCPLNFYIKDVKKSPIQKLDSNVSYSLDMLRDKINNIIDILNLT